MGVLIRGGDILERAASVTTVVLDKTGTITTRKPEVTECVPIGIRDSGLGIRADVERPADDRGACHRAQAGQTKLAEHRWQRPGQARAVGAARAGRVGRGELGASARAGDRAGGEARDRAPAAATAFEALPGRGVRATVDGRQVVVGSEALMRESGVDVAPLAAEQARLTALGRTICMFVAARS